MVTVGAMDNVARGGGVIIAMTTTAAGGGGIIIGSTATMTGITYGATTMSARTGTIGAGDNAGAPLSVEPD
jgi:hypothetical protein